MKYFAFIMSALALVFSVWVYTSKVRAAESLMGKCFVIAKTEHSIEKTLVLQMVGTKQVSDGSTSYIVKLVKHGFPQSLNERNFLEFLKQASDARKIALPAQVIKDGLKEVPCPAE